MALEDKEHAIRFLKPTRGEGALRKVARSSAYSPPPPRTPDAPGTNKDRPELRLLPSPTAWERGRG